MLKLKNLFSVAFLVLFSNAALSQSGVDADTFWLLDVNKECFSTENILGKQPRLEYIEPAPLPDSEIAVYKATAVTSGVPNTRQELKNLADQFYEQNKGRPESIKYFQFMNLLSPQALINIVENVLKEDEQSLKKIAGESYHHVTDFTKIVLVEGQPPHNYKIRLHLWWPKKDTVAKKLAVEDKHVHKWDFASRMYSGRFENQIFVPRKSTQEENKIHNDFIQKVAKFTTQEQKMIFDSINMIEMGLYKKSMFHEKKYLCTLQSKDYYTLPQLLKMLDLNIDQMKTIIAVHVKYVTEPNMTGKYGLKKTGLEFLNQPNLYDISDGNIYVERYQLAHRLISNPNEMTATVIMTAPPVAKVEPYLLMREETGEDVTKVAPKLSVEELRQELKMFLEYMKAKTKKGAPQAIPEAVH